MLDQYLAALTVDEPQEASSSTELEFLLSALSRPELPMSSAGQAANSTWIRAAIAVAERVRREPSLDATPPSFSIGTTADRRNPGNGATDKQFQPWNLAQNRREHDEVPIALGNFRIDTSGVVAVGSPAHDGSGIAFDAVRRGEYSGRGSFDDHSGPIPVVVQQKVDAPAGLAAGGEVSGPGSSIGDKIPAWLSDGEFVMNARTTAMNRPFLQALNADPYFLQKMLASRSERGSGGGPAPAAPGGQPAMVNISMSNDEDIIARLKVLAMQWELSH